MDAVQWSLLANLHPSWLHVQIFKWTETKMIIWVFLSRAPRCHGSRYHYNLFIVSARLCAPQMLRTPRAPDTVSIVNTCVPGDTWLPQGSSLLAQSDLFIGQWISKSPAIGCTVPRPQTFDGAKLMIRQKVKFLFVFQSFSPFLHSKWCRKKVVKWGFLTLRKIRVNGLPFDIYISFSFYWCALDQQVTRKTLSNFSWTDFLFVSHCLWLCWLLTNQRPVCDFAGCWPRYLGLSGPGVVSSHVTPDIVTSWHWPPRVMMGMTP